RPDVDESRRLRNLCDTHATCCVPPRGSRARTRAFILSRLSLGSRRMTSPAAMMAVASRAPAVRPIWRVEIAETVKLAWPMALTQLGQIAMMTTDLALIGRLGADAVAAVGLAHLILFIGFVVGMGPVSAVAPLAAQAFGARDPRLVRRSLRV